MATQGYKMNAVNVEESADNLFHTTTNGIKAYATYDGEEFVVLTNSQIDITKDCRLDKLNKQRETALKNGYIAKRDSGYFLDKSVTFTSPSSAACFVLGGSRNGWIEWKNQDGKTLDEIYRK